MIKGVIFDYDGVLNKNYFRRRTEIFVLAEKLRQAGYKTAVLSNMASPFAKFLKRRGDFNDFDVVIISSEIGISKPNPEIYKSVLSLLKLQPEECIFVDDKLRNLKPPRKMGLHVVLAKSPQQIIDDISSQVKL